MLHSYIIYLQLTYRSIQIADIFSSIYVYIIFIQRFNIFNERFQVIPLLRDRSSIMFCADNKTGAGLGEQAWILAAYFNIWKYISQIIISHIYDKALYKCYSKSCWFINVYFGFTNFYLHINRNFIVIFMCNKSICSKANFFSILVVLRHSTLLLLVFGQDKFAAPKTLLNKWSNLARR